MIDVGILRKAAKGKIDETNARSVIVSLDKYGAKVGLDLPHRYNHYLCQLMHESGAFKWDEEIWGPTPAQKRYDIRTDLGNTPERDGDGYFYRGRTAIQLTGKANYTAFRDWVWAEIDPNAPDFVKYPDKINEDPWEGLAPIWFWTKGNRTGKSLNRYADQNNIEQITKVINGGLNGFADRQDYYVRLGLVILGFNPDDVKKFQIATDTKPFDGDAGPLTRAAIHKRLSALTGAKTTPAPVVAQVPVAPPQIDKPLTKTTGFFERVSGIITAIGGLGLGAFFQDWRIILATAVALVVISLVGLALHKRIIDAVKYAKDNLNA
jgi:putative chitinase